MTTSTLEPQSPEPPAVEPESHDESAAQTIRTSVHDYIDRVKGGDVGSLPAVLGLIVLVAVFSILRPDTFTNSFNFANLINQSAAVTVIAMGLVFVLLLGEIDLSAGYTAGVAGAMLGVVVTDHGWPWWAGILVALLTGLVIGTSLGLLVAYLGIPSFVVTLAAFLGFQGLLLLIIGEGGTIAYRDDKILALMNDNLPIWLGWTLYGVGIAAYALLTWRRNATLRAANLKADPVPVWAIKLAALAVITGAAVWYLSIERSRNTLITSLKGVPVVVVVLLALLLVLTFLLSRTGWGRHVYAVGGNSEAARRAGIDVSLVKLSCFAMCSTVAAIAGILLGSRDNSISPATGGSETLLYAVGAAVIGGASLFGGKGRIIDAVIGGLVVAVINNGMLLLEQPAGRRYIVTGIVLLVAASVDALSRRRAAATGRA
jgi:D-xylose transport system permease protein